MPSAATTESAEQAIAAVEAGLPFARYRALLNEIGLPASRVAPVLSLSARTVGRRRQRGRFGVQESDRICRLERMWRLALSTFGETGAARGWLDTPKTRLGGRAPLELLATEAGGRLVEMLLSGIEVLGEP